MSPALPPGHSYECTPPPSLLAYLFADLHFFLSAFPLFIKSSLSAMTNLSLYRALVVILHTICSLHSGFAPPCLSHFPFFWCSPVRNPFCFPSLRLYSSSHNAHLLSPAPMILLSCIIFYFCPCTPASLFVFACLSPPRSSTAIGLG